MKKDKSNGIWLSDNHFVTFAEMQDSLSGSQFATRTNSAEHFTALFSVLPDPDKILHKAGNAVETYNKMEYDPHIYAEIQKRKALTSSLELNIIAGNAKEKYVRLVEEYLTSRDHSLFQVDQDRPNNEDYEDADINDLIDVGLDAVFHGYQPVEVVWGTIGTMKLPVKLIDRPRHWFHFDVDNRLRFRSKAHPVEGELCPKYSTILFQHKPRYDNPYGQKVLSRCFWAWMFKHSTEKWKIQFLEKFAAVWAIGKLPRGKDNAEYSKLMDALDELINSGVAVIPDDGSVEIIEAIGKGTTSNVFDGNIKLYNEEMSKAILTVTSLTGSESKGSYASDQVRERMVKALALSDRRIIEKKITQLLEWIFEVNGWGPAPYAELWEPESFDKTRADRDKILTEQGVKFTKNYFIKNYNFEEDDIEITTSPSIPLLGKEREVKGEVVTPEPLQFAEPDAVKKEEDELTKLLNAVTPLLEGQVKPILNSVKKAFDESASFAEALDKVQILIPKASTDQIEEIIAKANYIAFLKGSADAISEEK